MNDYAAMAFSCVLDTTLSMFLTIVRSEIVLPTNLVFFPPNSPEN